MTDEPRPEKFPGRMAPVGLPSIICPVCCSNPRPPGRKGCFDCYTEGYYDNKGKDCRKYPKLVKRLKMERARKRAELADRIRANRSSGRTRALADRISQLQEYDRLVMQFLDCLERDSLGAYQLYADRLQEMQVAAEDAFFMLPIIRKIARVPPSPLRTSEPEHEDLD